MVSEEQALDLAKEMYSLLGKWKMVQGMKSLTDMFESTYDLLQTDLDRAEYAANEDIKKVSEVLEKKSVLGESKPHLNSMREQVDDAIDKLIPETIDVLEKLINLGDMEAAK